MNFFKKINNSTKKAFSKKEANKNNNESKSYFDFIPHACHYNHDTIINKDGELVQIIEIKDSYLSFNNSKDIRGKLRTSIINNIKIPNIALWVYTVRKPTIFNLQWNETGDFSDELHNTKDKKVKSHEIYVNEIYIALVTDKLCENASSIIPSLSFSYVKNKHKKFLDEKINFLNNLAEHIIEDLKEFNPRKLGILRSANDLYRSELIEFFYYLMTFQNSDFFLDNKNISSSLSSCKIETGFHVFKISSNDSVNFGSIIGIKDYVNAPLETLDVCLKMNYEFIVIEVIRFVKTKTAISSFTKSANLLKASKDQVLFKKSHLQDILSENKNPYVDFCEHKINFLILSDKISKVGKNVTNMINALSTMGIVPILYDIHMEDNFWSHFPGNFEKLINTRYCLTKYSMSFATLNCFYSGPLRGSRWKEAITIFFCNRGNPYFFNFHVTQKGHTLILGAPKSGRTLLLNFILSESRRLNTKLIIFDNSGKSVIFIKAINGKYHKLDSRKKHKGLFFNPLQIENNFKNRNLLKGFFQRLLVLTDGNELTEKIVEYIFALPIELRTLSSLKDLFSDLDNNPLERWVGDGEFSHLLSENTNETLDWKTEVIGINIGFLTQNHNCFSAIMYYLLSNLENHLDGSPTILVLDESWKIHNVFPIKKEFDEWLEKMTALNVVVIFTTENIENASSSEFTDYVAKHIDTQIFMPNFSLNKVYMQSFGLSKEEFAVMLQVPTHSRNFFIKQDNSSMVLQLNLNKKREINVLSANEETLRYMYESINEKGENSNDWLPLFYEKCNN